MGWVSLAQLIETCNEIAEFDAQLTCPTVCRLHNTYIVLCPIAFDVRTVVALRWSTSWPRSPSTVVAALIAQRANSTLHKHNKLQLLHATLARSQFMRVFTHTHTHPKRHAVASPYLCRAGVCVSARARVCRVFCAGAHAKRNAYRI